MAGNRAAATAVLYKYIAQIVPGGDNLKLYKAKFDAMTDKEFDDFIEGYIPGRTRLVVVSPNGTTNRIDIATNLRIAQELGNKLFQKVWIPARNGARSYLTPNPYLIVYLPNRRQAQMLAKKISLAEDINSTDAVTGQVTGKSKGAKISLPEVKVLASMGLDNSLLETLKFRGGDEGGQRALLTMLDRTGQVRLKDVEGYATGVKSTMAMNAYLKACHLSSTL